MSTSGEAMLSLQPRQIDEDECEVMSSAVSDAILCVTANRSTLQPAASK